jgi:hypothetical protein
MINKITSALLLITFLCVISCKKEVSRTSNNDLAIQTEANSQQSLYDLHVTLRGEGNAMGQLKFRQDPNPEKIVDLDIKIYHLIPNHEYQLQRAVDPANVVDGNCTSTTWLTLGKGLTAQSVLTDDEGKGSEDLWRDVSAVPSGSLFDIHFRVIDAQTQEVVLTSDCYKYEVR